MIDLFSLALTHCLMAIAAWRLVQRPDLDPPARARRGRFGRRGSGDA